MEKINKKAQANIIVLSLIILIAIIAVVILGNILIPLITQKSEQIDTNPIFITLRITSIKLTLAGAVQVTVERSSGGGEIDGLTFIFYDEGGNSEIKTEEALGVLESKTYYFGRIGTLGKINSVAVVPIINNNQGALSESNEVSLVVPSGVLFWKKFDKVTPIWTDYYLDDAVNFRNKIAISFWINSLEDEGALISGTNYGIVMDNGFVTFSYGGQTRSSDDRVNLNDGNWHQIVVGTMGVYIDGKAHDARQINLVSPEIENDNFSFNPIVGEMNDFIIFNRTLSYDEVLSIYNNQLVEYSP